MKVFTWPNLLSLLRLPLAAAFTLTGTTAGRAVIVAAAALSDFVDGQLARRLGWRSRVGEILDPITDKIFTLTALLTFLVEGRLALWELLLLLARDLYNGIAFFLALAFRLPLNFPSRWSGKITTTLQLAALLVLLFWPGAARPIVLATGAAALVAIFDYTRAGLRTLRQPPRCP